VWVPPDGRLHIALAPSAHPPAAAPGVVRHWTSEAHATGSRFTPIAPLVVALRHALTHLPPEHVVAVLDSVLHRRLLQPAAVDELLAGAPRRIRRAVTGALDARAESGLESIVRYLLRCAGIRCDPHVRIPGIGDVDLLIDGWLIIEADGSDHATVQQMRKDRVRDAVGVALGMRTLRFGGDIVLHDHARLIATVRQVLAEGRPRARSW
jgi:very-short-patch-repair endonuclease